MDEKLDSRPELDFNRKIKLSYSNLHGRGIFATDDFEVGELIERSPMIILSHRMNYHKDPIIWGYMFTNTCPCDECKKHGGHFLMVLGYAQLYNHQDSNNAQIKFDLKNQIADIVALKPIKKGEEIFINYGPKYFSNRPKIDINQPNEAIKSAEDNSCTTQNQENKVLKPL